MCYIGLMSGDVFEDQEAKTGQTYSVPLTEASPSLLDEQYGIPYENTSLALETCDEVKKAGGRDFTLMVFNRPNESVRELVGSALSQLAGIQREVDLGEIVQKVLSGDTKAGIVSSYGLFIGSGQKVDETARRELTGAKIVKDGAKAVFDVSGNCPKLTVSRFTFGE